MAHKLEQVSHPKAQANRVAKAIRIVAFLETSDFLSTVCPESVAALGPAAWEAFAAEFDETVPSVETIAVVIGVVAGRAIGDVEFTVEDGEVAEVATLAAVS
ncbi:MAG TPA: hypothetical protein VMW08_00920 [Acidimicrobiales bacterium]|nr:hypothetical protein [Acidimicrobiales bacterium]